MKWHLLNQHYVNLDSKNLDLSVLEELVSSGLQLVQLLVSGSVSQKTMNSVSQTVYNQKELTEEFRL